LFVSSSYLFDLNFYLLAAYNLSLETRATDSNGPVVKLVLTKVGLFERKSTYQRTK
jgi:hypothetical protein